MFYSFLTRLNQHVRLIAGLKSLAKCSMGVGYQISVYSG
ncbi:MAG: hypothetical protein ACI9IT_002519 [Glaciecola sp.]